MKTQADKVIFLAWCLFMSVVAVVFLIGVNSNFGYI